MTAPAQPSLRLSRLLTRALFRPKSPQSHFLTPHFFPGDVGRSRASGKDMEDGLHGDFSQDELQRQRNVCRVATNGKAEKYDS